MTVPNYLVPPYTYTLEATANVPAAVMAGAGATLSWVCAGEMASDLDENCEVDFRDNAHLANAWAGGSPEVDLNIDSVLDWRDIRKFADEWLACYRAPAAECWSDSD